MRRVAVINQKGGVGKTTVCTNLAHALVLAGQKVTVLDLDPQAHLTASLGIHDPDIQGMASVLLDGVPIDEAVVQARERLQLVPAGSRLGDVEHWQNAGGPRGELLQQALQGRFEDQDFVLFDCPPASGFVAVNALFAVDEVLIPMPGDYLALQGLSYLMGTLHNFEQALNRRFTQWIVLARFQARRRLAQDVRQKLLEYFPGQVLATQIRETAALAECSSFGKTIFEYRAKSQIAGDCRKLADDFLNRRTM